MYKTALWPVSRQCLPDCVQVCGLGLVWLLHGMRCNIGACFREDAEVKMQEQRAELSRHLLFWKLLRQTLAPYCHNLRLLLVRFALVGLRVFFSGIKSD